MRVNFKKICKTKKIIVYLSVSLPKFPIKDGKKICSKCLIEKGVEHFWEEKRNKNGYHARCRDCVKIAKDKYADRNKDKIATSAKIRGDKYKERRNFLRREKLKNDPDFLVLKRYRTRLCSILKDRGIKKTNKTISYLGCSSNYLKNYIEKLFKGGMNWENRRLWDIDHIRPCCSFDLKNEDELKKCFHYTNLQPLWKEENSAKIKEDLKLIINKK